LELEKIVIHKGGNEEIPWGGEKKKKQLLVKGLRRVRKGGVGVEKGEMEGPDRNKHEKRVSMTGLGPQKEGGTKCVKGSFGVEYYGQETASVENSKNRCHETEREKKAPHNTKRGTTKRSTGSPNNLQNGIATGGEKRGAVAKEGVNWGKETASWPHGLSIQRKGGGGGGLGGKDLPEGGKRYVVKEDIT